MSNRHIQIATPAQFFVTPATAGYGRLDTYSHIRTAEALQSGRLVRRAGSKLCKAEFLKSFHFSGMSEMLSLYGTDASRYCPKCLAIFRRILKETGYTESLSQLDALFPLLADQDIDR